MEDKDFIEVGGMKLPIYIKDLHDDSIGKLNQDGCDYEYEFGEYGTMELDDMVCGMIEGTCVSATKEEYVTSINKQKVEELWGEIDSLNYELAELNDRKDAILEKIEELKEFI